MGDTADQKPRILTAQQPGSIKGVRNNTGQEMAFHTRFSCGFHEAFAGVRPQKYNMLNICNNAKIYKASVPWRVATPLCKSSSYTLRNAFTTHVFGYFAKLPGDHRFSFRGDVIGPDNLRAGGGGRKV